MKSLIVILFVFFFFLYSGNLFARKFSLFSSISKEYMELLSKPLPYVFKSKNYSCRIDDFELENDLDLSRPREGCLFTGREDEWEIKRRIALRKDPKKFREALLTYGRSKLRYLMRIYTPASNNLALKEKIKCYSTMFHTNKDIKKEAEYNGFTFMFLVKEDLMDIYKLNIYKDEKEFEDMFRDQIQIVLRGDWEKISDIFHVEVDFSDHSEISKGDAEYAAFLYNLVGFNQLKSRAKENMVRDILTINAKDKKLLSNKTKKEVADFLVANTNIAESLKTNLLQNINEPVFLPALEKLGASISAIQPWSDNAFKLQYELFQSSSIPYEVKCRIFEKLTQSIVAGSVFSDEALKTLKGVASLDIDCIKAKRKELLAYDIFSNEYAESWCPKDKKCLDRVRSYEWQKKYRACRSERDCKSSKLDDCGFIYTNKKIPDSEIEILKNICAINKQELSPYLDKQEVPVMCRDFSCQRGW